MYIFMTVITAALFLYTVIMPKRMSRLEIYITNLFILIIIAVTDLICTEKYYLYEYIAEGVQWFEVIILLIIYPSISTITLNYYARLGGLKKKVIYTLCAVAVYTFLEGIFVYVGFLKYIHWKLYYSAIAYMFFIPMMELHFYIIHRVLKKNTGINRG